MADYIIKNGFVVDPSLGVNCEKMDVAVKNGKIVDASEVKSPKTIDASGMVVMAGAVDVHSHSAGPKVNVGRNFRPEDKLNYYTAKKGVKRMESGFSVPTTFSSGYTFAKMGYGFAMEAAMPPLYARHVHEEIRDTPIIDEGALPVLGNNWFVMEYLKNHEIENTASYIAWLLRVTKGYGIKCVNPGGTEAWGWGMNCITPNDPVPYFDVTPKEIIRGLIEANEYLRLPHSMHLHSNSLGEPGNYQITIESLKCAEGIKADNDFGRDQVLHHTHLQFHSYGGESYASKSFESKSKEVMDYVNTTDNLTFDMGQVTLDETTTMTADGPFEYHLSHMNNLKWANKDVELETAAGIVPFIYNPNSFIGVAQWAIGLELALYCKDMTKCYVTTDAPNAGPIQRYPRVIKWLMSSKAREQILDDCKYGDSVRSQCYIGEIDRELSLYEIALMTRVGASKCLGLSSMFGSLKPGMEGDVSVYAYNPETDDDPEKIEQAFGNARYFIKRGELIINEGEIISNGNKRTFWVNPGMELTSQVERDVTERFKKYYTVTQNNYEVKEHHYMPNPYEIEVKAV
ncbi:formylmethanofuran dehydrogenase subunit A [Methanomicrobium antiquum]|uniref:Formylmethanofuran dehydrogenase subunit A n=1 Tax=Methanomicrobium antiquum TaxID=487686 RepID=A0AAF0FP36_9EURY|nr:formylmethanofuran dehydrogenase subunit A [Methanomicrobium antiquum]MDD3977094.1 formylmethanofuran dehydrogenase subunit A [Methanomicrobium sp.]WFN37035.1 formylmethanofuran dehydrogenase subunit A [Methanomicrobium antiquum]